MAVASAAVGVYGAIRQRSEARKARKAEAKSRQLEQRRAELTTLREQRKVREQARRQRAAITAQGIQAGVGAGSSAVQGQLGSISTQAAESVGFSQVQQGFTQGIFNQQSSAARHQSRAGDFGTVSNLAFGAAGTETASNLDN